ncbi:MAG: amino acid ABC transporter ATP-binding protein [Flavonifractor plautii]
MTLEPILEVCHLSKSFGTHQVLRDVNFTVHPGDVTSILGSSGSGKSTLVRCINLLERPNQGEVRFHGRSITGRGTDASAYRTRVGMVFQSFNLFSNMNVLENCMAGPVRCSAGAVRRRGPGPCATWSRWAWRPTSMPGPEQLSGGQKQRGPLPALAGAGCSLRQPTSALDPEMVGEVLAVMRALAASGMTMLVVTHEMAFARDVSSQVVSWLTAGFVVRRPRRLLLVPSQPRTREFLARFMASNRPHRASRRWRRSR